MKKDNEVDDLRPEYDFGQMKRLDGPHRVAPA
jgi:hypothetical protein